MSRRKIYGFVFIIFVMGVIYASFYKWSVGHATFIAGGVEHPINCIPCHVYPQRDGFLADLLNEDYHSPLNAVVSKDGTTLYVTAQDSDQLIEVNLASGKVVSYMPVGRRPHSVELSEDSKFAFVSNQWSGNLFVIDLRNRQVIDTIWTGGGPASLALGANGEFLYVPNTYTNNISVIDIDQRKELKRLHAGNYPTGVAVSPKDQRVYVSSQRSIPVKFRSQPQTEVTILNTVRNRVSDRKYFSSAHIMENIAVTPDGGMTITTLVRPKNLVPSAQIEKGWMINHGIGVIMEDGKMAQLLLDEPNSFYPDPYDVVIHPNGNIAYVSHSGVDVVSVIDLKVIRKLVSSATEKELRHLANHLGLSDQFVLARISTGSNPKGLAISPDGKYVYVVERMEDRISVIDTELLATVDHIDLGGPGRITVTRRGGQLFNNASHTFHNQYSCYTCHPDGHEDGLTYDLTGSGRNLANVQTLRDLAGTAPFKWNGKNVSVYMQCGMRFSKFVTRTESFSPKDLDAVVAYIKRELTHPPNIHSLLNGALTEAQKRGKAIYERTRTSDGTEIPIEDRCITCHNGPNYSNFRLASVGSLKENDDPTPFDAPNLNNVYESAPYLHDGSAATLEEIWTKFNDHDTHGYANDLTKDQLNDLIEYLKCLGAERYYTEEVNHEINQGQL